MKRLLTPLTVLFVMHGIVIARGNDDVKIGLFGHAGYNFHSATFDALPTIPCCSPGFDGGGGFGWDLGLMARVPFSSSWFGDVRLGYMTSDGTLTTDEARTVNLNGEAVPGTIRHTMDASLPSLRLDLLVGLNVSSRFKLMLGPTLAYMLRGEVTQKEELIEPTVGTFENGGRERLVATADIPELASLVPMITLGASFDIPLDEKEQWTLSPEVLFSYGISDITSAVPWSVSPLRAGVTLLYAFVDDSVGRGAATVPGSIRASVNAVGLEADGREVPSVVIRIEEFLGSSCKPLLPYVFFDAGSSEIPARYTQRIPATIGTFTENGLHQMSMLDTYYQLLDILGSRMREYPQSTITLTGCISEDTNEEVDGPLAQDRATAVRNYLVNTWSIDASRIVLAKRGLPAVASNVRETDGVEENRRVEIESSDPRILDPVWTTDTVRTVTPPALRFQPTAVAERGMASWTIMASQGGKQIKQLDGNGQPPSVVDWNLQDDQAHIPRSGDVVVYRMVARDVEGTNAQSDEKKIAVDQRTISKKRAERIKDKEIDRYAIIGFDFSDDKVQGANARLIERIRQKVTIASTINVVGSTDRMGDAQFNMDLSKRRATSVAKALNSNNVNVTAIGETAPVHTNDLPEGRFYNRTVTLVVETPVNSE
ncbi:MAG: OmpA family protein [Ignavibacteria bacterium]|nr:OmpA family protein [Ignavibacteria bacterium]